MWKNELDIFCKTNQIRPNCEGNFAKFLKAKSHGLAIYEVIFRVFNTVGKSVKTFTFYLFIYTGTLYIVVEYLQQGEGDILGTDWW